MSTIIEIDQQIGKDPTWVHFGVEKIDDDGSFSFKLSCLLCNSWTKIYEASSPPLDKAKRHLGSCRCAPSKSSQRSARDFMIPAMEKLDIANYTKNMSYWFYATGTPFVKADNQYFIDAQVCYCYFVVNHLYHCS